MTTKINQTKHNHKPNFGRIEDNCPRCDEIVSERAAVPEPEVVSMPKLTDNEAFLLKLIEASKRGTPEEEAEKEAKKLAQEQAKRTLRATIEMAEQQKRAIEDACSHTKWDNVRKQDFGTAIEWKRHSQKFDREKGELIPVVATGICVRCNKVFGPEPAHLHPEAGGVVSGRSYSEPAPA